jgi:predicted adenylyl cyclase CyaB
MPLEFEYRYYEYDKKKIIKILKNKGGEKKGHYLFKVFNFENPSNKDTSIRIRDEGHRITMTFKEKSNNKIFVNENEIIINDFDEGVNILLGLGLKKKYYFEKMREIWHIKNSEIVFDMSPGIPELMEIESTTKKELLQMISLFDLDNVPHDNTTNCEVYKEKFGIIIPNNIDLTFKNVKKDLTVTKNKKEFNELISIQKKIYNKIK